MSTPTTPPTGVIIKERFPQGDTQRYARNGWDASLFKAAGTADVWVEIAKGEWRPRRVGVLVDKDRKLWACGACLLGPIRRRPEMAKEVTLTPKAPTPAPPAPRPSDEFLARYGVFPPKH